MQAGCGSREAGINSTREVTVYWMHKAPQILYVLEVEWSEEMPFTSSLSLLPKCYNVRTVLIYVKDGILKPRSQS